jgi:SAM-dependent methyltransferase
MAVTHHSSRQSLRRRFDEAAELYDRARPSYPNELFDDLIGLAELKPGARVLEIGCGTGQATVPLARRGFKITALDIGASMAAVAQGNLAPYPDATVVVANFEDWPLPEEPFDLVMSATAFHWLDPAIRVNKAADSLRAGGALAIIATHHVAGGTEPFFVDVQRCYERWDPTTPPNLRMTPGSEIPVDTSELDHSGRFEPTVVRRYEWEQPYTTATYIDVLRTYSDQRARPPAAGASLLECIKQLIDSRYGGAIRKRYMNELHLARRLS